MKPTNILIFLLTISAIIPSAFAQNRALYLDGSLGYMEVPSSPSLDVSTELTIELWFTNDIPENVFLITKNGDVIPSSYAYGLYTTGGSSGAGFHLSLENSGVKQITCNGYFADGRWHHLAGTFDGQIMTLYVNGVERASLPLREKDEIVIRSYPLQIGAWLGNWGFHSGLMDEVRLWRIARTQEEIQTTMNVALTGEEEGLVGYWNFDGGAEATVQDLSSNGNNATLLNGARIMEYPRPDVQDTIPPTVVRTIPSSTENVPIDIKEIKFFFSKRMNEGWAIEYLDNLPLGDIAWDDDVEVLTLNIEQPLQPSTVYFAILNPIIAARYIDLTRAPNFFSDTAGNLLGEFFFTFTTEKSGEVDITPPTITEIAFFRTDQDGNLEKVLSDLSKEVPTDVTDIGIVFSERMREKGNQSLKYSDNFPGRNARWNKGGENSMTLVTIHLREALMPESKYYIRMNVVDKKYADLAGNLLKPYTITFVTTGGSILVPEKRCIATTWGAVRK